MCDITLSTPSLFPCSQIDDSTMDVAMNPMFYRKQELAKAAAYVCVRAHRSLTLGVHGLLSLLLAHPHIRKPGASPDM